MIDGVSEIVLDYQGININNAEVFDGANYTQVTYDSYEDPNIGSAIRLYLTDSNCLFASSF